MAGLVPFNLRSGVAARPGIGFENFYNMLDDFFGDGLAQGRNLMRDTFKIDIEETEKEYLIEAELPGVKREEIDLGVEDDSLRISVTRAEGGGDDQQQGGRNFIHRERRVSSMSRSVRLSEADLDSIGAKLADGVLSVTIAKQDKAKASRKIDIG